MIKAAMQPRHVTLEEGIIRTVADSPRLTCRGDTSGRPLPPLPPFRLPRNRDHHQPGTLISMPRNTHFAHVLKHELLHTRIRPREVNGERSAHPPEFWEEENRIAGADKGRAWEWIYGNFYDALKRDTEHECIWVNNRRMKELLHNRHCAEQDLRHLRDAFKRGQKGLRFGFREEALRDFEPEKDF